MRAPPDWMNILRRMHGRNDIAPDLQQAMYRVVDPQVKAQLRPTAGRDTPFPVIFELSLLNPVSGLKPDLRSWRLERGGEVVGGPVQPASTGPGSPERSDGPSSTPLAGRAAAMPQPFNRGAIWLGRTTLPVGRHELILVVDIGLKPVDPGRSPIDWTKRVVTPITLEVAPKGQDIQLVRSSDVDAALRRCLFMAGSYFKPSVRAAVRSIRMPQASRHAVAELGHVPLNFPAPVDAAIQVRVLLADGGVAQPLIAEALISATEVDIVDGRSGSDAVEPVLLTIGLLLCYKDSRDAWFLAERSPACLDAVLRDPAARIVLEPAPDAARRTPEMVRIWGGQLMLRPHEAPIPVRPPLPTALDRFR